MKPDPRARISCLSFVLILAAFTGPAWATAGLDEKIDLSLEDARADEVFRIFGQILQAEVTVDPQIEERVTIEIHDVTVRTAMTAVCESVDCTWSLEPGEPKVLTVRSVAPGEPASPSRLDELIDISLRDADLVEVLRMVASMINARLQLDPSVEGMVTVEFQSVRVDTFLDQLCFLGGCRWRLVPGDRPVLKVEVSTSTH